jgi:hypothetical protein
MYVSVFLVVSFPLAFLPITYTHVDKETNTNKCPWIIGKHSHKGGIALYNIIR